MEGPRDHSESQEDRELYSAVRSLAAVEVGVGSYAVKHGEHWYIAPASDLTEYAAADRRDRSFIAATWKPLPLWWEPDYRKMGRCKDCFKLGHGNRACGVHSHQGEVITADLETGAEIPA